VAGLASAVGDLTDGAPSRALSVVTNRLGSGRAIHLRLQFEDTTAGYPFKPRTECELTKPTRNPRGIDDGKAGRID
jgi:hypothetical protein